MPNCAKKNLLFLFRVRVYFKSLRVGAQGVLANMQLSPKSPPRDSELEHRFGDEALLNGNEKAQKAQKITKHSAPKSDTGFISDFVLFRGYFIPFALFATLRTLGPLIGPLVRPDKSAKVRHFRNIPGYFAIKNFKLLIAAMVSPPSHFSCHQLAVWLGSIFRFNHQFNFIYADT